MPNPDIRRPDRHEGLIENLLSEVGIFSTMRDVLVFSACVGFSKDRQEGFDPAPNPIAWETMSNNSLFESIVMMIAASVSADNPEFLGDSFAKERARMFEEYACGGLSVIQEEVERVREYEGAVLSLVSARMLKANAERGGDEIFDPFDLATNATVAKEGT